MAECSSSSLNAANKRQCSDDEISTQLLTKEGVYRLNTLSELSRPNRLYSGAVDLASNIGSVTSSLKVSFAELAFSSSHETNEEFLAFNYGRELFVYPYRGLKKAGDVNKPIDKRIYKGTSPTCHDFTSKGSGPLLLVGFSGGQIQLLDPSRKDISKLYNEERLIEKSRVTSIKWLPDSSTHFLVSHSNGSLYVYKTDLPSVNNLPSYSTLKSGDGFSIQTCKSKGTRNPLSKWIIGVGASVNDFSFSPSGTELALVTQDGYLRHFTYESMELHGSARSYFGGFLCLSWSPDEKYIVMGGEDDLITVYSLLRKGIVCRGVGHKSWVSSVSFDPYFGLSESSNSTPRNYSRTYRLGSVSQDTHICLWDMTEEILSGVSGKSGNGVSGGSKVPLASLSSISGASGLKTIEPLKEPNSSSSSNSFETSSSSLITKLTSLHFGNGRESKKKIKYSKGSKGSGALVSLPLESQFPSIIQLGSPQCPRIHDIPLIEPLLSKKISHERLTSLIFKEECFVTACQDGYICTWERPGKELTCPS